MVRVALVIPGEQEELMQLAQMLQHMDSVRSIITFVYPDESEIDEMFAAGDIQAAILFSKDFYEDVNTGVNTPVQIRLDEAYRGTELFRELLTDVVTIIDVTEAASYAMIDHYYEERPDMSLSEMEDLIMDDNVALLFGVRGQISIQILSPTGKVDLLQYYVSILCFMFLLLPGLSFWSLYDPGNRLVEDKLGVYGVGRLYRSGIKIALMAVVMFLYVLVGLWGCNLICGGAGVYVTGFEGNTLFHLAVFSVMMSCFYHGILLLSGEQGERRKILFLLASILLLAGGCVVPCAYLPGWVETIAPWTPFYVYRSYLEQVLFEGSVSYVGICVWALVFLIAGEVFYTVVRAGQSDACEYADAKRHFRRAWSVGTKKTHVFRSLLYLKWQWKRKSPLIVLCCALALIGLCVTIRFPQRQERIVYLSGEEALCQEIEADSQMNQVFRFVYEADEEKRKKAVVSGQALAAVEFSGDEIMIYTNAVSPDVLVARETVAVASFRYSQRKLLETECREIFGTNQIYDRVYDAFVQYIQNDELFHVEFQME